jgi:hypothetical protein
MKFQVTLAVPFDRGAAHPDAIARQCRHFNEGHSVDGDIDCFPPEDGISWDGDNELSVELTVSTSKEITLQEAEEEAVQFWNFFSELWLSEWFTSSCGEPTVESSTSLLTL